MKTNLKAITISGQREAFVVCVGEREIGTIARASKKAAWSSFVGIGAAAKFVGTSYAKEGAKFLITQAIESKQPLR